MRSRVVDRLYTRLPNHFCSQKILTVWYSSGGTSGGDDSHDSDKKDAPLPSNPITQLFKELNLDVRNTNRQSRERTPPRPAQPVRRRPGSAATGPSEAWQDDKAWARNARPQVRGSSESFGPPGEDEYGMVNQQRPRPRQRDPSRQGKARRGQLQPRRGSPGAGQQGSVPARRRASRSSPRTASTSARSREARALRDAPQVIQDLAAEEEYFRLREGEPMALINKKTNARIRSTAELPIPQRHIDAELERAALIEIDPTVNINWGAPVRLPKPTMEQYFEAGSQNMREALGIESDQEWDETKHVHFQRFKAQVEAQNEVLVIRDEKADEAVLFGMRDSVPQQHPMKHHVEMVVHQLTRNPGWSFQQKHQYMTKLLHEYVHKAH